MAMSNGGKNSNGRGGSRFDLEARTERFAADVRTLIRALPRTICNEEDIRQLVRCSGSTAANYIEGNDALGRKDFIMRLKTSRREAKESGLFLRLVWTDGRQELDLERARLVQEASELVSILSAILLKVESKRSSRDGV